MKSSMEEQRAIRVIVKGRVQGIGFRYFVLREAQALHLAGYVKNCPDGTVEVVAEGEVDKVDHLLNLLKEGPPLARVDSVVVNPEAHALRQGFQIR